jgi:hypothetical protein
MIYKIKKIKRFQNEGEIRDVKGQKWCCFSLDDFLINKYVFVPGGLFHPADDRQEVAFRYAVDRINADRTILPRSRLSAQIERISPQDSFHASKRGESTWKFNFNNRWWSSYIIMLVFYSTIRLGAQCAVFSLRLIFNAIFNAAFTWHC